MKYEDIKDFNQRCEEHKDHQTGMISYGMISQRLQEEIDELREYIEQRTAAEGEDTRRAWVHATTWRGLTDEDDIDWDGTGNLKQLVEAVEDKLKAKNT